MTINMRTMTKRVTNSCNHKRCKVQTTKINIMMIRKVISNYNEKRGKEDNDQHEDRDEKGCEQPQAQEMQNKDQKDQDHDN